MKFRDRLRAMFARQEKQSPIVVYTGPGKSSRKQRYEEYAEEGYKQNAIVYRCVNEISQGAAAVDFRVYSGDTRLDAHPLLNLVQRPNPRKSSAEYFQALYAYLLIAGNAYGLQVGPDGRAPQELYLLRPDRIRVVGSNTEVPAAYEYVLTGSVRDRYPVDADGRSVIKHFLMWNPLDDYLGMSPVHAAALDIDQHNLASQHNVSLLMNGARPSGALVFKPRDETGASLQLTEGQRQQLLADLEMRFSGSNNAGRPLLLEGDFDWREMGLTPKDMDFLALKNMAARDIALCFGVPGQLVGVPDAQTYANVAEARLSLYEDTIIPLMRRVESDLNEWLSPQFDDVRVEYDIDSIPAIAERKRKVYENVVSGVNAGIITRNEARERLGLEAVDGADELYIGSNLFPIGAVPTASTTEKQFDEAYGKRILDTYPDGSPLDAGLPDTYRPHSSYRKCANCGFREGDWCEKFDAEIRQKYVCNAWIGEFDDQAKAEDDFIPTEAMASEARKALDWRKEGHRGGTLVGVARANQLAKRENLSRDTVMRMYSYFARHEVDKEATGFRPGEDGYPSPGRVAWGLWGGDPGQAWANRMRDRLE